MSTIFDLNLSSASHVEESTTENTDFKHHMSANSTKYVFDDGIVPLFIKTLNNIPSYIEGEKIHTVIHSEIDRIDLISWMYYGNVELWWTIVAVNNLNPFNMTAGMKLRIIPKDYIEYNLLRYDEE